MATVADAVEVDSGVASSPATPEEKEAPVTVEKNGMHIDASESILAGLNHSSQMNDEDIDDDDDLDDVDETLFERLWGLTEMFPETLQSATSSLASNTLSLIKNGYSLARKVVWVTVSTSVILFAPVMFELERINVEEMMKQDRNRLVLGPGSAMSGPSASGLIPSMPSH